MELCVNCGKRGQTNDSKLCASCWVQMFEDGYRGDGL